MLFILIAPVLLMLSAGWRLNTRNWKIQRTGLLLVDLKDPNARISLDGAPTAPTRTDRYQWFSGLFPGRVSVRVQKEGARDWQRSYWITKGLTTYTSPVVLFPNVPARRIATDVFRLKDRRDDDDPLAIGASLPKGSWEPIAREREFALFLEKQQRLLFVYDRLRSSSWTKTSVTAADGNRQGLVGYLQGNAIQLWQSRTNATETTALERPAVALMIPERLPIVILHDATTVWVIERGVSDPLPQTLLTLEKIDDMALSQDERLLLIRGSDEEGPGVFTYPLPSL